MTDALRDDLLAGATAAAEYLGIDRRKVFRMTSEGQLPVIRKGRLLFYRKSDLARSFTSDWPVRCECSADVVS